MESVLNNSVTELSRLLNEKEISSREITSSCLEKISGEQKNNNAFITILYDEAQKTADDIDSARLKGKKLSGLAGVPYAVKDNICTKGIRTTCASKMLEKYTPVYDAEVVRLLSDGVILGKTNMDEFAVGSSSETSYFGRVENPLCKGRVPGGSSSGSAVCVTTNEAPFALGSDTGGSVRQPASFCGVVGYKPSYGLVSRYGLVSFASSFDQIGIISKNVPDCALIAKSICRRDKKDLTSVKKDISFDNIDGFSVKGKKIAVISELVSGYAKEKVLHAASFFASKGASIEYINMPYYDYLLECYYILSTAEISSNLARFDGIRYGYASGFSSEKQIQETRTEGFCNEVKRRIVLGTFVLSAGSYYGYYQKALNLRNSLIYEYNKIFSDYDFVLTPVSTVEPWPFGAKQDVEMYKNDMCTVAANLIGAPAVSVPAGFTKTGFPAGVQLMAAKFCDGELLAAAAFLEKGLKGDPHA